LLPIAAAFASYSSAQSIDHPKQLFDDGKYAEAKTEFLALQKANDQNATAAYYLGRIATNDNDSDEATRQFERAVRLEDGNALYHFWLGNAVADAAPSASKIKQPFMARRLKKEWERAVELDPNQVDARFRLVQFFSVAPGFMGGSMDKAREQADEIEKRNPMRGALARGTIAEQEKNGAAAAAAYEQAIAAGPDSAAGYFTLGIAYARSGKPAEAFATLDRYVKRRPDDGWALYQTGRFAGITGQQLDRGEGALNKFLTMPPADAHVPTIAVSHYWLGQIAEKRGDKGTAREQYRTALKINPKNLAAQRALESLK
jgi:tetratricopeptide (TPR) repeat protein